MDNKESRKLNVGIIGYGGRGTLHTVIVNLNPKAEVKAICDTNKKLIGFLNNLGITEGLYDDLERMLKEVELDAVYICTPNSTHLPIAKKCIEKNLHIFSEIPIADSYNSAKKMLDAAEKNNIIHSSGDYIPYQKTFEMAKHNLSKNILDRIIRVRASLYWSVLPYPDDIYLDKDKSDSGVIINLGSWLFLLLQWLFGPTKSLYAQATARSSHAEESSSIILNFANGMQGYCDVSLNRPGFPCPTVNIIVEGTRGIMEISSDFLKLHMYKKTGDFNKGWTIIHQADLPSKSDLYIVEEGYYEASSSFIRNCLENNKPKFSWKESLDALKIVEATYISLKEKKVIKLEEVK
ncbi:MAG: Gfo/Idh/MocA family oxidoreductase [Candidatus Aminicenantes bacterium]|nr:Gfo/Idh/MocA family oxidoreductase [Candidatus Aminicenantes bacterium]